jgi:predicted permease
MDWAIWFLQIVVCIAIKNLFFRSVIYAGSAGKDWRELFMTSKKHPLFWINFFGIELKFIMFALCTFMTKDR